MVTSRTQQHGERRGSTTRQAQPSPSSTVIIHSSPVLEQKARMGATDIGFSASYSLPGTPHDSPRLTATTFRSPKISSMYPPRQGGVLKTYRQKSASRGRKYSHFDVVWKSVISHYGRSPRGWAFVFVLFSVLVIFRSLFYRQSGKFATPYQEPKLETSSASEKLGQGVYNYIKGSAAVAAAMGQAIPQAIAHQLPDAITNSIPRVLGMSRPKSAFQLPSAAHTFHPDGLLLVNPNGRHPIHGLIERAEDMWRLKLHSQSRTMKQGALTYRKRYHRNPPAGFGAWWTWATQRKVGLMDEYDQIHRDWDAFHALDPGDLRHRASVMQERGHTFTVAIDMSTGEATLHGEWAHIRRATDMRDLIQSFSPLLPGIGSNGVKTGASVAWLNMSFIVDDLPAVLISHEHGARMRELSDIGEYFTVSEWVETSDPSLSNFARACPIDSKLRRAERGAIPNKPHKDQDRIRSFIHDHNKVMDLCQHPEFRELHGATVGKGVELGPLVPLFTFAKMPMHADVLVTPLEQYSDTYIGYDPPWNEKTNNKLLWRGSTTGATFATDQPWRNSQRARLHFKTHEKEGETTLLLSEHGKAVEVNVSTAAANNVYMDTSFAGSPVQCDDPTCKIMADEIQFAPTQGLDDSYQYKYLMDVDGNGWSGRFHRLMSTNSLVLKSTVFPEWYSNRIMPWVHYIPVKVDYSDLYDIMSFFNGDLDGQLGHDALAERIASAGKQWAKTYWRRVDMASYMFRTCLEYLRLMNRELGVEVDYLEDHI